jgi:hypothetical protein
MMEHTSHSRNSFTKTITYSYLSSQSGIKPNFVIISYNYLPCHDFKLSYESIEKAEILNKYFSSISNLSDENKVLPDFDCRCLNVLSDIEVCEQEVNYHLYLQSISCWPVFLNHLPYFAVVYISTLLVLISL